MTNPYTPPQVPSDPVTGDRPFPVGPAVGVLVGSLFLAGATNCLVYIVYLHRQYPGLSDPSPNVDAYWPAVAEIVMYVFAGIAALIGVPTFWCSFAVFRRRRNAEPSA